MVEPVSFGKLDFKLVSSMDEPQSAPDDRVPLRVLILGDFSGRSNRGILQSGRPLAESRVLEVDRDNLDDVLARMRSEIQLPFAGADLPNISLRFQRLDDFHPDSLYGRLEVFQSLRDMRRKLKDPRFFESLAAEIKASWKPETKPQALEPQAQETAVPDLPDLSSGSLLDDVIGATQPSAERTAPRPDRSQWGAFVRDIVRPHLVPDIEPQQAQLLAALDDSVSEVMRTMLHHPDFQDLEAAWRGVDFLVRRLETDERLKLYLLDISKPELSADLTASDDLQDAGLYKLVVEQSVATPGAEPWALLAGNFTFEATRADAEVLGRLAKIAKAAGAPVICAGHPHLLGCESLADSPDPDVWRFHVSGEDQKAWDALKKLPEAVYLGLALPRFLLRLPYGSQTDPVEQFDFEEMPSGSVHEHYLWGNPCLACACLIGEAFTAYGWQMRPGMVHDIANLPLHMFKENGDTHVKPCAEVVLTERAAQSILETGLMPLISFRDRDTIRLLRFQSVAEPPSGLAGRWG